MIDLHRQDWALKACADIATSDMMIVSCAWSWRADDGLLRVGNSISHHQFQHLETALGHVAQDLPAVVGAEMLALFD